MTFDFAEMDQARLEWAAWGSICRELERHAIDINEEPALHATLVWWGEMLATLRQMQDPKVLVAATEDARHRYGKHIGITPETYPEGDDA